MDTGDFSLTRTQREGTELVTCAGDLSTAMVVKLTDLLDQLLAAGTSRLILELREVGYICSAGLGALVQAHNQMKQAGGRLVILSPGTKARQLLAMTRLDTILIIYNDLDQALASFKENNG